MMHQLFAFLNVGHVMICLCHLYKFPLHVDWGKQPRDQNTDDAYPPPPPPPPNQPFSPPLSPRKKKKKKKKKKKGKKKKKKKKKRKESTPQIYQIESSSSISAFYYVQ